MHFIQHGTMARYAAAGLDRQTDAAGASDSETQWDG